MDGESGYLSEIHLICVDFVCMCLPLAFCRQGANGYVLSMGTKIWDPERSPEQGPEQSPEQGPEWKN